MKPKSFSLVLSLLSDHIQGNTDEKDSDFNRIKFYLHLYQYKRKILDKIMIKTVLWNKCEIYLFAKEMENKKGIDRYDTWKSFIS